MWSKYLNKPVSILPLAVFRILFGGVMLFSLIRFIYRGWIEEFYITPKVFFPFYGFEWVKPLSPDLTYLLFGLLCVAAVFIILGLFYRISATFFFLAFTYIELIDKTYYLNHYYFISVVSFLLIFLPANRYFSLDVKFDFVKRVESIPAYILLILKLQIAAVYFFAGLAKLNADWMFEAMPLRIWLPANSDFPLIGFLFDELWVAYLFSWLGAFFDLLIPFFLFINKTRKPAYLILAIFHILTGLLFPIGVFPLVMILLTLVFFSDRFHNKIISILSRGFRFEESNEKLAVNSNVYKPFRVLPIFLGVHLVIQTILPFRYLLYPGNLFWTEEGFRFSWRVMLMEKGGTAFFFVHDQETGKSCEVSSSCYLTPMQEKMMVTQPDMILQFAHFLDEEYKRKGIKDPVVTVESYVTLNGSGSKLFIDKNKDLSTVSENMKHKDWILPYSK